MNWAQFFVPYLPAFIVGVITLLIASIKESALWFAIAVLTTVAVLAVRAVFEKVTELQRFEERPRPYLQILRSEVQEILWHMNLPDSIFDVGASARSHSKGLTIERLYRVARVVVANDPPVGSPGEDARAVAARLFFRSTVSDHELEVAGHWMKSPQGPDRSEFDFDLNVPIDLPANGRPEPLDIAIQDPGDGSCYAFNDLNTKTNDGRLAAHALKDREYIVYVEIRASNAERLRSEWRLTTREDDSEGTWVPDKYEPGHTVFVPPEITPMRLEEIPGADEVGDG